MENDLEKQDRQTDEELIECEFWIYSQLLGVDPDVLKSWRSVHNEWRYRS